VGSHVNASVNDLDNRIRILLVDRNTEFLDAAAHFLEACPEIEVVGQARTCPDALDQASQLQPHVVIAELGMPGASTREAMTHLKTMPRPPRIVILTIDDQPEYHAFAHALGADGCVNKAEFGEQVLPLLRRLCA
jgi:DNA-binding NarL/FixJ family response regulator